MEKSQKENAQTEKEKKKGKKARKEKPGRMMRFINSILKTVEQAVLSIPGLILTVLVDPGPPLTALKMLLIGLAWLWIGDFLIAHTPILRLILDLIQVFAKVAGAAFELTIDSVEVAIDAAVAVANVGGDVINGIGSLFGDKHVVPKIPSVSITQFPPIDFSSYVDGLDQFGNATLTCQPFNDVGYLLVYPLRSLLNDHFCPIVRYTWNTIIYVPFSFMMGFGHFDADPNGANCADPHKWIVCFWLKFGAILVYVLAPLHLLWWLLSPIKKLILDAFRVIGTGIGTAFSLVRGFLHDTFHSMERKKST